MRYYFYSGAVRLREGTEIEVSGVVAVAADRETLPDVVFVRLVHELAEKQDVSSYAVVIRQFNVLPF